MKKYTKPTFKMSGSKARLASWWVKNNIFPMDINSYYEPFLGRGNVFYNMSYYGANVSGEWHLNDLNMIHFTKALLEYEGDWSFVTDDPITKEMYLEWMEKEDSPEKAMAESYMCRQGNVWGSGANTTNKHKYSPSGNYNCHSGKNTRKRLQSARYLLQREKPILYSEDWKSFIDKHTFSSNDFLYADPPYNAKQTVFYDNINHLEFLNTLKSLDCRVAISGYWSELYENELSDWNVVIKEHTVNTRKSVNGKKPKVKDYLWINYDLTTKLRK